MVRAVVDHGLSKAAAARRFNTTPKTVAKWVERFKAEGVVGLRDRSSKPLSSPSQIPLATADAVERLRRQRRTQEHIADELGISKASVSRILKRRGLSLLSSLEPQQPRPRYERDKPGEIIHLDIKKLGRFNSIGHRITGRRSGHCSSRGVGWEYVHVAIDDHSRVARADIFPDQKKESASRLPLRHHRLLQEPRRHRRARHDRQRSCYRSKTFARACKQLGIKHITHQALYAADQRQGRALHPDRAPRMGLRHRLRALRSAPPGAPAMAPSLQLASGPMLASPRSHPSAASA